MLWLSSCHQRPPVGEICRDAAPGDKLHGPRYAAGHALARPHRKTVLHRQRRLQRGEERGVVVRGLGSGAAVSRSTRRGAHWGRCVTLHELLDPNLWPLLTRRGVITV